MLIKFGKVLKNYMKDFKCEFYEWNFLQKREEILWIKERRYFIFMISDLFDIWIKEREKRNLGMMRLYQQVGVRL